MLRRRTVGLAAVASAAVGLTLLVWLWVPLVGMADLLRGRFRMPTVRLLAFGTVFAWLELAGVSAAAGLWLTGRGSDTAANRRLQKWWAQKVMNALRSTCGLDPEVCGLDALGPGPVVVMVRHASLADSLLAAWAIMHGAQRWPRVVMKSELLVDPCLDIVGNRIPNCFIDRGAADSAPELERIEQMGRDMSSDECAVIFPEGTRANPAKRRRALDAISQSDPERAERLSALSHMLPPRRAGVVALLSAAPQADVVLGWHTGFEGLDGFGGIIDAIGSTSRDATICFERFERDRVPSGDEFGRWLDERWLAIDRRVGVSLAAGSGSS